MSADKSASFLCGPLPRMAGTSYRPPAHNSWGFWLQKQCSWFLGSFEKGSGVTILPGRDGHSCLWRIFVCPLQFLATQTGKDRERERVEGVQPLRGCTFLKVWEIHTNHVESRRERLLAESKHVAPVPDRWSKPCTLQVPCLQRLERVKPKHQSIESVWNNVLETCYWNLQVIVEELPTSTYGSCCHDTSNTSQMQWGAPCARTSSLTSNCGSQLLLTSARDKASEHMVADILIFLFSFSKGRAEEANETGDQPIPVCPGLPGVSSEIAVPRNPLSPREAGMVSHLEVVMSAGKPGIDCS